MQKKGLNDQNQTALAKDDLYAVEKQLARLKAMVNAKLWEQGATDPCQNT